MQQALFPDAVEYDDGESTLYDSYIFKALFICFLLQYRSTI